MNKMNMMNKKQVEEYINVLKSMHPNNHNDNDINVNNDNNHNKTLRVFTPYKYFKGLKTKEEVQSRFHDIIRGTHPLTNDPSSYREFATDRGKTTKPSKYTLAYRAHFGDDCVSMECKSERTGIPLFILEKVFQKGKAAWRTGHRVGAGEDQWGHARVNSFVMMGCTTYGADFHLFKQAIVDMKEEDIRSWIQRSSYHLCPLSTRRKPFYTRYDAEDTFKKILDKIELEKGVSSFIKKEKKEKKIKKEKKEKKVEKEDKKQT